MQVSTLLSGLTFEFFGSPRAGSFPHVEGFTGEGQEDCHPSMACCLGCCRLMKILLAPDDK